MKPIARLDPESATKFLLAGNATIIARSPRTGRSVAFTVRRKADDDFWWIHRRTGPGFGCCEYIGFIGGDLEPRLNEADERTWRWLYGRLLNGMPLNGVELFHTGRCSRCGKPTQSSTGIGPSCSRKQCAA